MSRNLGLTHINTRNSSSRAAFDGGTNPQPGSLGANTHPNLIRLPALSSLPAGLAPLPASFYSRGQAPFERSNLLQAPLDALALGFWIAFFLLWFGTLGVL